MIRIERVGLATTVQDRGRPGWSHLGVGRSGAADMAAHDLANRLVGNPPDAATVETSGGMSFMVLAPVLAVLTGARCAAAVVGGPSIGWGAPQTLAAGSHVDLGVPHGGLRTYLALRGGLDVAVTLGSRARDTLGLLGPELRAGSIVAVGADPRTRIVVDVAPASEPSTTILVEVGPRLDWFTADAWSTLCGQDYEVQSATNRVGARLAGSRPIDRSQQDELPSEGLLCGAIQVAPDGQPTIMLADHPVTGGYPVLAVVTDASLASVAQARPATTLRFAAASRASR